MGWISRPFVKTSGSDPGMKMKAKGRESDAVYPVPPLLLGAGTQRESDAFCRFRTCIRLFRTARFMMQRISSSKSSHETWGSL